MIEIKDNEFNDLVKYMKNHFGINLSQKRGLIEGRLNLRVQERGFTNYEDFFKNVLADTSGSEMANLINVLTTNHTFFLRENQHFDFMNHTALPRLADNISDNDLRIWSAGCSSGEEAYTTAMVVDQYFGLIKKEWDTTILATDISTKVLAKGAEGIYAKTSLQAVPDAWKKKYFTNLGDNRIQIKEDIRKQVIFRPLNLMDKTFPFKKKFHVIFCRNVMIYFDNQTKNTLIDKFYDVTVPGGYLFIGHAESIANGESKYKYIQPAIFQKPY